MYVCLLLCERSLSDVLSEVVLDGLLPFDPRWIDESLVESVGEELLESVHGVGESGLRLGDLRTADAYEDWLPKTDRNCGRVMLSDWLFIVALWRSWDWSSLSCFDLRLEIH